MGLSLEIPEQVSQAIQLPPSEVKARLKLELAIGLYSQQILSLGKAAELAEISRFELGDILARRSIPMHYSQEDLSKDVAYARGSQ